MPGRLQDKVAIVTGASSGIGRAICLAYSREGARVVCADLQPSTRFELSGDEDETRGTTHDRITEAGGQAIFVEVDVRDAKQVEELVAAAVKTFGRLDIMVNNAGIGSFGSVFFSFLFPLVLFVCFRLFWSSQVPKPFLYPVLTLDVPTDFFTTPLSTLIQSSIQKNKTRKGKTPHKTDQHR